MPAEVMADPLVPSIGQVVGKSCPRGEYEYGTGFLWPDAQSLVTAWHVVAGCESIEVRFPNEAGPVMATRAGSSLPRRDLALLKLDRKIASSPLEFAIAPLPAHTPLTVLGYPRGVPTPGSSVLAVASLGPATLPTVADLVSGDLEAALDGIIDVDTAIIRLNGDLQPGHSGAPLVDSMGVVRAIGSGGFRTNLDDRRVVTWGVSASYLTLMGEKPDIYSAAVAPVGSRVLSPAIPDQDQGMVVRCGHATFHQGETRALAEIYRAIPNDLMLDNFLRMVRFDDELMQDITYEVWSDEESGAIIYVPHGGTLKTGSDTDCVVQYDGEVEMRVVSYRAPETGQFQAMQHKTLAAQNFGARMLKTFPIQLSGDPQAAFYMQEPRDDGFLSYREGYFAHQSAGLPGQSRSNYLYFNHLSRHAYYVGVAGARRNYEGTVEQTEACGSDPYGRECTDWLEGGWGWAKIFVAIFLSSMPYRD